MLKPRPIGSAGLLTSANRTTICEGEFMVSSDAAAVLTAILGSCIAACLHDPVARVGGMNHFLLANPKEFQAHDTASLQRYGVHAMEQLVNTLIGQGASRPTLRAHIYGGANMHAGMHRIGDDNAAFARRFLDQEGIALVRADTGGQSARRVEFRPALGVARSRQVAGDTQPTPAPSPGRRLLALDAGEVDLF